MEFASVYGATECENSHSKRKILKVIPQKVNILSKLMNDTL